jgi:ribosomal-protein-alanine N-acetyltransferase
MDVPCRTRPATRADLAAIARIESQSFSDPWPASAFQGYLGGCFLVAESPTGLLGYLVARVSADEGEILDVAVDPGARGRGVGRCLLASALADLEQRGVRHVYLEVRESNAVALRLYASMRFAPVGRRRGYYRQPAEDALILARETVLPA